MTSLNLGCEITEKTREKKRDTNTIKIKSPHTTITDNNIGIEGAQSIGEALKTNTSLTSLNLGCEKTEKTGEKEKRHKHDQIKSPHTTITGNNIGVEGAQSIGEALKTNTSLTSLNLGCEITEKTREKEKRKEIQT